MKLYFTRSSCVVIIFFNMDLSKSVFFTYSFRKLVFRLSVFYDFFLLYFEFNVILVDLVCNIYVIIVYIGTKYSVVLISPKSFSMKLLILTLYKLSVKT